MIKWTSDLCNCISNYEIIEGVVAGELMEPCEYHTTFEDTLISNRLKNTSINTINDLFDMSEKNIDFSFNYSNGEVTLYLTGFTESELEIVYALNLEVNIVVGV